MKGKDETRQDLEEGRSRIESPFGYGCPQSPHPGRPLAASGSLYGSSLAHSGQSNSSGEAVQDHSNETARELEAGRAADEIVAGLPGEGPIRAGNVDILGSTSMPADQSLRQEGSWNSQLKPSTLTRLLNSTSLGIVATERQVYRHRKRAGLLEKGKRRIDFYRYIAWLVSERHQPTPHKQRTVREKGDCDLNVTHVLKLIKTASYRCALTGRKLTPETAALDHCIPVSRGGKHEIANAQLLHRDVNRAKGTLTNEEFIDLCRDVVKHVERQRKKLAAKERECGEASSGDLRDTAPSAN